MLSNAMKVFRWRDFGRWLFIKRDTSLKAATMNWQTEDIITGERLQQLAQVSIMTPPVVRFHKSLPRSVLDGAVIFRGTQTEFEPNADGLAQLRGKSSIFVYSHLLPSFIARVLPELDHRFVLISHNSDAGVDARFRQALDDPRIVHWFGQNAMIEHPKLTPLPIGIANAMWPHGSIKSLVSAASNVPNQRKKLVYCNFAVSTNPSIRVPLRAKLSQSDVTWCAPTRRFADYLVDMASCKWCVSPTGNGVDCHRTWEALYLGVVPIVSGRQGIVLYEGLPIIFIEDLRDISKAVVDAEQRRIDDMQLDLSHLTMSRWRHRIGAAIQRTGQ